MIRRGRSAKQKIIESRQMVRVQSEYCDRGRERERERVGEREEEVVGRMRRNRRSNGRRNKMANTINDHVCAEG
jgi:hypothetical protein